MGSQQLIILERSDDLIKIWLNRPEKGNALNISMIRELNRSIQKINEDDDIRSVIIGGKGKHFCTGADLHWMKQSGEMDYEDNLKESLELAELYHQIFYSSKIFIARINGACYGGGIGLAVACDFIIASGSSSFAFSEVKLGLVPATIAPYVVYRTGGQRAKQIMLTGDEISASGMKELSLVDMITDPDNMDKEVDKLLGNIKSGGKRAQQSIKRLIADLGNITDWRDVKHYTAEILARARSSSEGKEGILAYLEKRDPKWKKDV